MSALANDLNAATDTRAIINAANAQLSTGPRTSAGKDAVKFNALKTGLFAQTVVLPDEQQSAYEALGAHLDARWKPATQDEREVVLAIQNTTWRLNRAVELDSSLYAIGAQQHLEAIEKQFGEQTSAVRYSLAQAAAYLANPRPFDQISRQEGRLQRMLDKAKAEITALISHRLKAAILVAPPTVTPTTPPRNPATGFVPPKYPKHMPTFTGPNAKTYRRLWLTKNGYQNLA